jgi:L-lactate dehydrogenase complex protein LldG
VTDLGGDAATSARGDILARIGLALSDRPPTAEVPRAYETSTPASVDLVGLFAERVADYRATVHRCSPAALAATIGTALAARGARRIAVPAGVDVAWLAEASMEVVADTPPLSHSELDGLDGVITACAVAIAETGTIVLDAGTDQGRRALSLLPDYHLCIVLADQIVGGVPEALPRLDPRRPLTWISGPSATSDIELERVEGVHGPRTLEVVIVETGEPPREHA